MIKKIHLTSLLAVLFLTLGSSAFAQGGELSIGQKVKIKKQLNEGRNLVYAQDYRGAYTIFKKILSIDSENAEANFRSGQCLAAMGKPKLGKKYSLKALSIDSVVNDEVYFVLGESYHRLGELENAKKYYNVFKSKTKSKTWEDYEVDRLIAQCDYAKLMMENPVDVTITNMGSSINTFNPEYSASISANGKVLVFTSRRADTKGGQVDEQSDNLYFEDIYISLWNDTTKEWSKSKPVEGSINTERHDAVLSISPDGRSIYVYKNVLGETKSGDIYSARAGKENKFGTPKPIDEGRNVNSSYFEGSASVTGDEQVIYFVSDRPGGNGQADIYTAKRQGKKWSKPVNVGDSINSDGDEKGVFIHPNGQIMFFVSNGHNSLGSYDIFVSRRVDGNWTKAENLGYPINTVGEERTFSITADGTTAYISAEYDNSKGGSDIYLIDLTKLEILKK